MARDSRNHILKPRTRAVHAGIRRSHYGEVSEALFLTQGFAYPSAEAAEARFLQAGEDEFVYARYGNPTTRMFEDRLADIEGAEDCFATASGMAAVHAALMAPCRAGDHVVASRALFGSCLYVLDTLMARYGVEVCFVDGTDLDQWRDAVRPGTRAVFFESLSNPGLEVIDIAAVCEIAHAAGALVVCDNAMATPVFSAAQRAGVDLTVYSTTKHVDGQGRCLGGAVLGSRELIRKTIEPFVKHTGGAMSPFHAWIGLKGIETLDLRVRAQAAAAQQIAAAIGGHPKLARVLYPTDDAHPQAALARRQMEAGGTVLAIDLAGGKPAAFEMLNRLRIFTISNNFADAKSIVTHPSTTTHQRLGDEARARVGITPGLVRVSCGLEDPDDLVADLLQALD